MDELEEARRRLEETERERDELRQELEAIKESHQEPAEPPEGALEASAPTDAGGEPQVATKRQEEERRGWLRRFFGL